MNKSGLTSVASDMSVEENLLAKHLSVQSKLRAKRAHARRVNSLKMKAKPDINDLSQKLA